MVSTVPARIAGISYSSSGLWLGGARAAQCARAPVKLPKRFLAKVNQAASGKVFVIVPAGLKALVCTA